MRRSDTGPSSNEEHDAESDEDNYETSEHEDELLNTDIMPRVCPTFALSGVCIAALSLSHAWNPVMTTGTAT